MMKNLLFVIALSFVALAVLGCNSEEKRQADKAAWDDLRAKQEASNAELDRDTDSLRAQLVETMWGAEAGRLWVKCRIPPKDAAHQRACRALHDRLDKYEQAEGARAKSEAAKW